MSAIARNAVFAAAFVSLSALGGPASAQETDSPEALAVAYVTAMRGADWARIAAYMHPEALAQFKSMFGEISALDPTGQIFINLLGVADSAAYDAAAPETVFGSFMGVVSRMSPELDAVLAGSTAEVIGTVDESRTGVTHLVYRMHMDVMGMSANKVQVMPMKRHEGEWRVLLSGDIEGMATAMKQQMMQRPR